MLNVKYMLMVAKSAPSSLHFMLEYGILHRSAPNFVWQLASCTLLTQINYAGGDAHEEVNEDVVT
jgi:hypothetical protein